jgi:transposase
MYTRSMYPYVASKMTNSNLFQKIQKNTKNTKISKKYKNFQKIQKFPKKANKFQNKPKFDKKRKFERKSLILANFGFFLANLAFFEIFGLFSQLWFFWKFLDFGFHFHPQQSKM